MMRDADNNTHSSYTGHTQKEREDHLECRVLYYGDVGGIHDDDDNDVFVVVVGSSVCVIP